MLGVTIIAVGKLKEVYFREAVAEYKKRLAAFCRFQIFELPESRLPKEPSQLEIEHSLLQEGRMMLSKIPGSAKTVALCIEGNTVSSENLAEILRQISREAPQVCFFIGSSHGLSSQVKQAADFRISMSAMTFPHQLARVLLCEQLYRAFCIDTRRKYHK